MHKVNPTASSEDRTVAKKGHEQMSGLERKLDFQHEHGATFRTHTHTSRRQVLVQTTIQIENVYYCILWVDGRPQKQPDIDGNPEDLVIG